MTNSIDRLLRDALGGGAADHPATPCPDVDLVAALAEDTLTRDERSRVEAHVIQCVRCQAWLSALEKTRPPAPTLPWWRRRAIAWLVPVAAAATALAIWTDVTRHAGLARSDVPFQAARNDARSLESASKRERGALDGKQRAQSPVATPPTVARSEAAARKPEPPGPSSESDQSAHARTLADSAAATPEPPPPAPPPEGAAAEASTAPRSSRPITPAPPSEAPTAKPEAADRGLVRQRALAADSLIASADASHRWRVADGVVQHSSDGGMTWQSISTGMNVRITAGASPSPAVCWLVGPGGTVALTTDEGRIWRRLAFPEAVDLISVRPKDGGHAEIVTADGRTFRTSDGGRTWSR